MALGSCNSLHYTRRSTGMSPALVSGGPALLRTPIHFFVFSTRLTRRT